MKRGLAVVLGLVVVAVVGAAIYSNLEPSSQCDVCHRPLHQETYYRIHMADGESMDVCCPRCGLRFQKDRNDVVSAEVTDFESKRPLDAEDAFYVAGSPVHFCSHAMVEEDRSGTQYHVAWDRCLPSLIAFESRAAAVRFQEQNGGAIKTYAELLEQTSRMEGDNQ